VEINLTIVIYKNEIMIIFNYFINHSRVIVNINQIKSLNLPNLLHNKYLNRLKISIDNIYFFNLFVLVFVQVKFLRDSEHSN
jgi:hypothetical protein